MARHDMSCQACKGQPQGTYRARGGVFGPHIYCITGVGLPEWSKGSRSGRDVFVRVGSNPTADIFVLLNVGISAFTTALQWYGKTTHVKPYLWNHGVQITICFVWSYNAACQPQQKLRLRLIWIVAIILLVSITTTGSFRYVNLSTKTNAGAVRRRAK